MTSRIAFVFVLIACGCAVTTSEEDLDAGRVARASAGWALLEVREQRALTVLLDGEANPWTPRARATFRDIIRNEGWAARSPEAQARTLRGLWEHPRVRPGHVATLALTRGREPAPYTLDGPLFLGPTTFPGGSAEAARWEVRIDGRVVPVLGPTGRATEGDLVAPSGIAEALARLPARPRAQIRDLVLAPFRNPTDAEYARELDTPGFRTFMEGWSSGRVLVFPQVGTHADAADVLLHEAGHVWSTRDLEDRDWEEWSALAEEDGHAVSEYATKRREEDLAETSAAYAALWGTPGFDEARAMFPARFAFLDRWASR